MAPSWPTDSLSVAFYASHRTRTLIAVVDSGLNVLNLMWFAATLRTLLADAGQDGWGAAAIVHRRYGEERRTGASVT
jgi:hypothetical protein